LRPSGNQVLANVYHVCDLARANELNGAYSFRSFVEQLNEESEREDGGEAPILEEGSDGVRIMTVHAAKGLEFPIVILADMTANAAQREADKHIDAEQNLCALRLMGCSPWELLEHQQEEHERDLAEGLRIAYVAATRARDLLVVPAVGDAPFEKGWLAALNKAVYPSKAGWRKSGQAPHCPEFGDVTVLARSQDYDGSSERSVRPGLHHVEGSTSVVWWDPSVLNLDVEANFGLRQSEILADDGSEAPRGRLEYASWKAQQGVAIARGQSPAMDVFTATEGLAPPPEYSADRIQVEHVERNAERPKGPRFGSLVHLVLRDVSFGADSECLLRVAQTHGRLLGAQADEIEAAAQAVAAALRHPLLERARKASLCHRELPVLARKDSQTILEAVVDLAFKEDGVWNVVDFKTEAEELQPLVRYLRQAGWYCYAMDTAFGGTARGFLLYL
jgi:ATP-dependent exoDNAse (exonuclease V) beta subunit